MSDATESGPTTAAEQSVVVPEGYAGKRGDAALAALLDLSRSSAAGSDKSYQCWRK